MPKKLPSLYFAVIACMLLVMAQPASATVMDFTVHGGQEVTETINLEINDRVIIKFSVLSEGNGSTLDFFIVCPNGTAKMAYPT